ncbi:MAG: hypothetical protein M3410_09415 [Acidobacteriota bacterium]|nr:hypothetical protein [Acidobacteriota bacterium]
MHLGHRIPTIITCVCQTPAKISADRDNDSASAFPSSIAGTSRRLPLKSYTTADGLAHDEINKIVRDSRGFLWFCTAEGLSRFDGYTFTNYGTDQGLPHRNVTNFLETRSGELRSPANKPAMEKVRPSARWHRSLVFRVNPSPP